MTANATSPGLPKEFRMDVLARYLGAHLPDDFTRLRLTPFVGGQSNPTFLVEAGDARYVLRKRPHGPLLPSAHAIDREYRVMRALQGSAVPVPRMRLFCEDVAILGTTFFVMDYVPGRVHKMPALPGLSPSERATCYDEMNRVIAAIHTVDLAAAGLMDYGRAEGYYARQIKRWTEQYRATEIDPMPSMERLIAWLPQHLPATSSAGLVHGDVRFENLIFGTSGSVAAVIDWELSTLGDPLGDLAYNCLHWHLPPDAFGGLAGTTIAGTGIPTEADYLKAYCRRTGRPDIEDWHFYVAFALFRLAAIMQGVLKRALEGNASSPDSEERGRRAPLVAAAGWEAVERAGAA